MPTIAIYTSAHGYGHSTRCYEVALALVKQQPKVRVHFMSWAGEEVFTTRPHAQITYRRLKLDVGLEQVDSLTIDLPGTLRGLRQLEEQSEHLVEKEVAFLQREQVNLVLCDLPALAFVAAADAKIPAYGLANFSWDWIYQRYVKSYPGFWDHIQRIQKAYRSAAGLFRLPFNGRMSAFTKVLEVPLVVRVSHRGRRETRKRLGIEPKERVALFSFGGYGLDLGQVTRFKHDVVLLSTDPSPYPGEPFRHISDQKLGELGLTYPDLVAAADAVISKPGYGIVSECIANRTALLYTPRGDFREYPILVQEMKKYLPNGLITYRDLMSGRWAKVLEKVLTQPFPQEMDCTGAAQVAAELLKKCEAH